MSPGLPVVTGPSEAGHGKKKRIKGTDWMVKNLGCSMESQADWGFVDGLDFDYFNGRVDTQFNCVWLSERNQNFYFFAQLSQK